MDRHIETLPVCVLIPAYNAAGHVARAIRSAQCQVPRARQVIVVDDGSVDDTAGVARSAGAQVVSLDQNQGLPSARNAGIRSTKQEWIALLDSDDEWLPGHLAALWRLRQGHALVAASALARARAGGSARIYGCTRSKPEDLTPASVIAENRVPVSSTLFRKRDALAAGLFKPELPRGEDLDFWIRLLERGTGVLSPEVITLYWQHAEQMSHDMAKIHSDHLKIARSYSGRPWWDPRPAERFEVSRAWDGAQRSRSAGDWRGTAAQLAWLVLRPGRARDLLRLWHRRLSLRRGGSRYAYGGEPSTAVLPGVNFETFGQVASADDFRDLRGRRLPTAVLSLLRRPTGRAAVVNRGQAVVMRAIGVKPVRVRQPSK